eukprot:2282855-Rhodomonas_salina.1
MHEAIQSGKVTADFHEWLADAPRAELWEESNRDGLSLMYILRKDQKYDIETAVFDLPLAETKMLAALIVSLDAWQPHVHDLQQLDALTHYLAGGLQAALEMGFVQIESSPGLCEGHYLYPMEEFKIGIIRFAQQCAAFTLNVLSWVRAGAPQTTDVREWRRYGEGGRIFQLNSLRRAMRFLRSQRVMDCGMVRVNRQFWQSSVPDAAHLGLQVPDPSTVCWFLCLMLQSLSTFADGCSRWYDLRYTDNWQRLVHESSEIQAGRMLPSRQWARRFDVD